MNRNSRRIAAALLAVSLATAGTAAFADKIVVTKVGDVIDDNDGGCTLREAIRSANGDMGIDDCGSGNGFDTILLIAGTYTLDLATGTNEDAAIDGDLDILTEMEIRGVSPEYTLIDGVAGQSTERLFHVASVDGAIIRNLRMTGGSDEHGGNLYVDGTAAASVNGRLLLVDVSIDSGAAEEGGGLYVEGRAAASLVRTTVTANDATASGGGAYVTNSGRLQLIDSKVIENHAGESGGGVAVFEIGDFGGVAILRSEIGSNEASADGGGIYFNAKSQGYLSVQFTTVRGNKGNRGAGVFVSGFASDRRITHSSVIDNVALTQGGGLYAGLDAFIRHSTFAGNSAAEGGAAYVASAATLFDAVTVSQNSGGGVFNTSGAVFEASLLADNAGGNCLGTKPQAGAFNLDDGNTCQFPTGDAEPNFVDTDPLLGPLADNGGPTPTFALLEGSPAIDAISSNSVGQMNCQNDPDQRNFTRGYPAQTAAGTSEYLCDIGAYEVHSPYVVDSITDAVDADIADGICATAAGECTLRAAVMQANVTSGLDEIEVPAGTYALSVGSTGEDEAREGDLDLLQPVTIRGAGADQTIIDAAGIDRAFDVLKATVKAGFFPPLTRFLSDLSITNGAIGSRGGAALRAAGQPVRLERAIIRNNVSSSSGGGIRFERSCVVGFACELTVTDSRIIDNTGSFGGGIAQVATMSSGRVDPEGLILIERSQLSGNVATAGGAGLWVHNLWLRNSTVSGNRSEGEDAEDDFGGVVAYFGLIENSTIVNNEAVIELGGGLAIRDAGVATNTIIADNGDDNCSLPEFLFSSAGHNLSDSAADDCSFLQGTDFTDTDPLIGPLADNGGLTQTRSLLPGSPAIDAGGDTRCPMLDQRGFLRPDDGDADGAAVCDIGAVELLSRNVTLAVEDSPDPVPVDNAITYTAVVSNDGPGDASGVTLEMTLPASLAFVSADVGNATCGDSGGSVECSLGDLAAGESLDVIVVATALEAGSVEVTASVTATGLDTLADDNMVTVTTTINSPGGGGDGDGRSGGGNGGGGGSTGLWLLGALALMLCPRIRPADE